MKLIPISKTAIDAREEDTTRSRLNMRLSASEYLLGMISVLLVALFLIWIRNPLFFLKPRIWAEEGSIYLQNALQKDFWTAFFEPHLGYYSLFCNLISGLVVWLSPLEYAAHFTTWASAIVQIATVIAIYASRNRLTNSLMAHCLISISPILFCGPWEWLNIISAQFWFATGTAFILTSDRICRYHAIYLIVSFFTGVSSLIFFPFFLGRFIVLRNKEPNLLLALAAGAIACLVQLASIFSMTRAPGTHTRFAFEYLTNIPLAARAMIPFDYPLAGIFILMFVFSSVYLFVSGFSKQVIYQVLLPIVFYSSVSIVASLEMAGGQRYALPVYCISFALILNGVSLAPGIRRRAIASSLIILLLMAQMREFFQTQHVYNTSWPSWREQVSKREVGEDLRVYIFPQWKNWEWQMVIPAGKGIHSDQGG